MSLVTSPVSLAPTGSVVQFGAATAPSGWLLCDGTAVSRSTYAALFAVISTTYGTGNGSTTFNIPDLRGRTAVGAGDGTASGHTNWSLGNQPTTATAGGEEAHLLTGAESGTSAHGGSGGHSITDPGHTHTQSAHGHGYLDKYPNGWYGANTGSDSTGWQADLRADTTRNSENQYYVGHA